MPAAPKKKMPYLEHGDIRFGDSHFMVRYLEKTFHDASGARVGTVVRGQHCRMLKGGSPDNAPSTWVNSRTGDTFACGGNDEALPPLVRLQDLAPQDRAVAAAVRHLAEGSLYQRLTASRWALPSTWDVTFGKILGGIPLPVRTVLAPILRRGVWSDLWAHGILRHSLKDSLVVVQEDLSALEALLAAGKARWEAEGAEGQAAGLWFLFGSNPCAADACLLGTLDNFLFDSTVKPETVLVSREALPHCFEYCTNLRVAYFGDAPAGSAGGAAADGH